MKYMGSKRAMLQNGLGTLLKAESYSANRVIDLFCGAASVSWFAATDLGKPVVACDLQTYSAVLAGAVIQRTKAMDSKSLVSKWLNVAERNRYKMKGWKEAVSIDNAGVNTATWRKRAQELCGSGLAPQTSLIWTKYGGHYFSPTQALSFDAMLRSMPSRKQEREVCLAAVIIAASRCAASPGHTAQPFKATRTAGKYLREAWMRDPLAYAKQALIDLCPLHAAHRGRAIVGDANVAARSLKESDLVFLDPPYSGVHYSRFYHVLETIARGRCGEVEGVGRYPPPEERPNSSYSRKDKSSNAMQRLLKTLGERGCRVIITFPKESCSNGLSGDSVEEAAEHYFEVARKSVKTRFSTLGGNTANRAARKVSDELMLVLRPK